ncbi:hypothetical protein ELH33_32950 (plasmid) [Rhizobium ruizarguesonis]|uniref:hypothetical protein n=1 Tax=Rhizobium ruizarguesonis TaxID=2081791 RepID=UPI00102F748B|nr:hypothetical protein [Rhizobium ruizarguesonis]TBC25588.1 hypothetical protein ELH33_32950 [Rhizobium ruizarguesonis]
MIEAAGKVFWKILLLSAMCVAQSCQPVLTTTVLETASQPSPATQGCKAGTYSIPRTQLSFYTTYSEPTSDTAARYDLSDITAAVTAEQAGPFCADFPVSGWSTDKIEVERSSAGLLKRVSTSNDDQSLVIAAKLVGAFAASDAARGNRGAVGIVGQKFKHQDHMVDPFDESAMRTMNDALKKDGYCIYVDPTDDPVVDGWQTSLCPGVVAARPVVGGSGELRQVVRAIPPRSAGARGIIYRPLLTHRVVTMKRNENTQSWELYGTQHIAMTNGAPVFLLEIRRSPFVVRTFDATFDDGVLQSLKVTKPSEAEAFSGFVLSTAQAIISIPIRALVIGKTNTQNRQALIAAQAELLETIYAFNKAVADQSAGVEGGDRTTGGGRLATPARVAETARPAGSMSYEACMQNAIMVSPANPEAYCENLSAGAGQ